MLYSLGTLKGFKSWVYSFLVFFFNMISSPAFILLLHTHSHIYNDINIIMTSNKASPLTILFHNVLAYSC